MKVCKAGIKAIHDHLAASMEQQAGQEYRRNIGCLNITSFLSP